MLIPLDRRTNVWRPVGRRRNFLGFALKSLQALIWTAVFASAVMAWAAQDTSYSERMARDAAQRQVVSNVSRPDPSSGGRAGSAVVRNAPESDADRFFRAYMLPGAAVLVLMIAITLVAIFFPKFKKE